MRTGTEDFAPCVRKVRLFGSNVDDGSTLLRRRHETCAMRCPRCGSFVGSVEAVGPCADHALDRWACLRVGLSQQEKHGNESENHHSESNCRDSRALLSWNRIVIARALFVRRSLAIIVRLRRSSSWQRSRVRSGKSRSRSRSMRSRFASLEGTGTLRVLG